MSERIAESLTISGVASGGISHVIVTNGFIYNAPQVQSDSLQINTADEVAISNIQIDSDPSAPAQNHGIHILNSGNVSVSDSHISRSRHGIYVQSTDSVRIDQTSIINSGVYGVKAGTLQDNSLVSITNSFIDHSLTDGINSDSGNLYVVNTKIVNSVGTGVYSSSLYCYCSDVIVDTCGSYCFYWLSNSKIEAENCTALNYGITGFEFDGGTALFSNCVASSTVTSFQVSGFVFRFNVEAAVMYNCTSYNNSGDGFLFVANSGLFTISDCTAYNNQDKGFDVRNTGGAFTFSNCTAYQNSNFGFYATAIAKSVALAFDNCVATLNGGDGFSMIAQISKFSSCSASANQGNGFSANGGTAIVVNCYSSSNVLDGFHIINNQALVLPYAVTLVMQNCVATANSQYGFYDGTANTMRNLSYTGNVAVANVVGNYNAAKGATPFFYKLAKDTAVNVFDNVLAELIV
jgi:parallel beta-helix repeat protein